MRVPALPLPPRLLLRRQRTWARAAVVACAGCVLVLPGQAQQGAAPPAAKAASAPAAAPAATPPTAPSSAASRGGPDWAALTPPQRTALAPLATIWNSISAAHKRKWLALSENFGKFSPDERARLHSRMVDWATLSPAQRAQARLNYNQLPDMTPAQKQAQWEAYQALAPEQKKALAAQAPATPPRTALARSANTKSKLATVPLARSEAHHSTAAGKGTIPATKAAPAAGPAAAPASTPAHAASTAPAPSPAPEPAASTAVVTP
jgi:hypothetical protein